MDEILLSRLKNFLLLQKENPEYQSEGYSTERRKLIDKLDALIINKDYDQSSEKLTMVINMATAYAKSCSDKINELYNLSDNVITDDFLREILDMQILLYRDMAANFTQIIATANSSLK